MPLTVGTAGHIDHGKTWLVRALTGKDTDRLPEEWARGISIDLGYAPLALPGGTYEVGSHTWFNIALVGLIALVLCLTLVTGWVRDALIVPTVWLAGFVWETRLAEEASGPTRLLLLGALLVGLMIARPQGLLGRPRVEIV